MPGRAGVKATRIEHEAPGASGDADTQPSTPVNSWWGTTTFVIFSGAAAVLVMVLSRGRPADRLIPEIERVRGDANGGPEP